MTEEQTLIVAARDLFDSFPGVDIEKTFTTETGKARATKAKKQYELLCKVKNLFTVYRNAFKNRSESAFALQQKIEKLTNQLQELDCELSPAGMLCPLLKVLESEIKTGSS